MIDPEHNFIREIFNRSWQCQRPCWVLLRAIQDLPPAVAQAARAQADRVYSNMLDCGAWDAFRGGWFEIMRRESPAGSFAEHMGHTNKVWWQQEEGIVASLLLYLVRRDKRHLEMARDALRFWLTPVTVIALLSVPLLLVGRRCKLLPTLGLRMPKLMV